MRSLLVVALLAGSAHADPKPSITTNGYTLDSKSGVYVKKGGQSAPLTKGSGFDNLKVNTKAQTISVDVEDSTCIGHTRYTWSFGHLDARLDNAAGVAQHLK